MSSLDALTHLLQFRWTRAWAHVFERQWPWAIALFGAMYGIFLYILWPFQSYVLLLIFSVVYWNAGILGHLVNLWVMSFPYAPYQSWKHGVLQADWPFPAFQGLLTDTRSWTHHQRLQLEVLRAPWPPDCPLIFTKTHIFPALQRS